MCPLPPESLTTKELAATAYIYIEEGLPLNWQKEILKRLEKLVDSVDDISRSL
jgi:hypothetical protein